jgi:hypothetical protein
MSDSATEEWGDQFDIVPEDTPYEEYPEEKGLELVCRIEGCEHQERLDHLGCLEDCDWTQVGYDEAILTNGDTLHLGYCPAHSLEEDQAEDPFPLEPAETYEPAIEREADRYAMYDFATEEVPFAGFVLRCDSCLREETVDTVEEAEDHGWESYGLVGVLADGHALFEGRCPEHQESE